jgi:hypothetical protein
MKFKKLYFQIEECRDVVVEGMCSVWEGELDEEEEGVTDRRPILTLPTCILAIQPLQSGLALLDQVRR